MPGIRIISGRYRGKRIPFNFRKFNEAEITTQKVKEALFNIIGPLEDKIFVDLFGGSGQIGFEALSRGSSQVIISETDFKLFKLISSFSSSLDENQSLLILNMSAAHAMRVISERGIIPDYIFADPPYDKSGTGEELYGGLIFDIEKFIIADASTEIIIQHFSKNELPDYISSFQKFKKRRYGTTSLSLYKLRPGKGEQKNNGD